MSRIGSDNDGSTRCHGGPVLFFAIEIDPVQVDRFLRDGLNGEFDGDRTALRFFGTLDMGGGGARQEFGGGGDEVGCEEEESEQMAVHGGWGGGAVEIVDGGGERVL
tara:strand:- start:61 stop:381 length:321 start_codon:yes stop_codon:yes gene_type:complete